MHRINDDEEQGRKAEDRATREEIAAQTEEFLRNGGKITQVPPGVITAAQSAYNKALPGLPK